MRKKAYSKGCETPHITEEEIKERFLKVYNGLIESKAAVIAACKAAKDRFVKCPELQAEMDELLAEMNEVTVLTQQCIADRQNGHVFLEVYKRQRSELTMAVRE